MYRDGDGVVGMVVSQVVRCCWLNVVVMSLLLLLPLLVGQRAAAFERLDVVRLVHVEVAHVVIATLGHSFPCRTITTAVSTTRHTRHTHDTHTHTHAAHAHTRHTHLCDNGVEKDLELLLVWRLVVLMCR